MTGLVLAAGFGGFERCEIGVRPLDLLPEASLVVDFDGDADFCEIQHCTHHLHRIYIRFNQLFNNTKQLEGV